MSAVAPGMGTSPAVSVSVAPAEFDTPVADVSTEPAAGGPVVVSGHTSDPDGTVLTLLDNGTPTPITTSASGGSYSFPPYTLPPNTTLSPVAHSLQAQSPL